LLIVPSPADWTPDRPGSPTAAADCAAWYACLQSRVDAAHVAPLSTPDGMRVKIPEASPSERVMYKALMSKMCANGQSRGLE